MHRTRLVPLTLLLALVGLAACSRGVTFDTDPGQAYRVNIINTMPHTMIVSFDDGTGLRMLGSVPGNQSTPFVVAGSASPTVTIVAHDEAETHTARQTVTLRGGETINVRIE